jgi:hypothetical protein
MRGISVTFFVVALLALTNFGSAAPAGHIEVSSPRGCVSIVLMRVWQGVQTNREPGGIKNPPGGPDRRFDAAYDKRQRGVPPGGPDRGLDAAHDKRQRGVPPGGPDRRLDAAHEKRQRKVPPGGPDRRLDAVHDKRQRGVPDGGCRRANVEARGVEARQRGVPDGGC